VTNSVSLPLWLLLVLVVLAAWAALERLLLPGIRWYFRKRVNVVINEVATRLHLEIPQFKLTRRQVLIDRLFYDAKVQEAVDQHAVQHQIPRTAVLELVDRYAREIVPSFNAYIYFRIGYWVAKRVAQLMYRVRLGYTDEAGLAAIDPKSAVVFVMNHRSNMDYILVAFLAAEQSALSYAVGEWARIWPLHALIRSMGAYFVRRNSGDPLYRIVLQRYVQMATEAGVCQAVFPEGGLSVDGKLRKPKLGLLDYMLKTFNANSGRDLVFVPVGINYDRVIEDRTLLMKLQPSARRRGAGRGALIALGFAGHNFRLMLLRRWHRFGYACVNFGTPLSMRDYANKHAIDFATLSEAARHDRVERLADELMHSIGAVIPVLPVSLVATAFMRCQQQTMSELEIKAAVYRLSAELQANGAHIYVPRRDQDYAISVGLRMLTLRAIVSENDGLYSSDPAERPILAYYANAVEHLFDRQVLAQPLPGPLHEQRASTAPLK
jgi:glycerol-3-phosphate O-acyltransferase